MRADLGGDGAVLGREALVPPEHLHQGAGWRQRCTQLVAQHGQEFVLGPVRRLGGRLDGEHLLGEIESDSAQVRRLTIGPAATPRTEGATALLTSGCDDAEVGRFQHLAGDDARRPFAHPLEIIGVDPTEELPARVAPQAEVVK